MQYRVQHGVSTPAAAPAPAPAPAAPGRSAGKRSGRLSYQAQRELSALPERLQGLEAEKSQIEAQLADGSLYRLEAEVLQGQLQRLAAVTGELDAGYARWAALEAMTQDSR
jgi:ATP-binding cassette subfamily F protein uup